MFAVGAARRVGTVLFFAFVVRPSSASSDGMRASGGGAWHQNQPASCPLYMQGQTGERPMMKIAAKSDVGRVRTNNEDSLLIDELLGLLIVADGMGGHSGGEVASAMAIATVAAYVRGQLVGPELAE